MASGIAVDATWAAQAPAQTSDSTGAGLAEIVVTAEERAESLLLTPLAVSAIASETISQRGISDLSSLAAIAPNLVIRQTDAATANVELDLRGIGEFNTVLTAESPVGIYER